MTCVHTATPELTYVSSSICTELVALSLCPRPRLSSKFRDVRHTSQGLSLLESFALPAVSVYLDPQKSSRRVDELERRFLRPQNTPEGGLETISNYLRSTMEVVLRGKQQKHLSLSEVEDIESLLLP